MTDRHTRASSAERVQLHLVLPYKMELRRHRHVQDYLARGYRIEELLRLSDREVVVTLAYASVSSD